VGIVIFWSAIAFFYFVLAIVTGIKLLRVKQKLSNLDDMSPSGIYSKKGEVVAVESELYNAIKAILVTGIIGFLLATAAAITSFIITT
jgi:hypothetical protein